MIEHFLHNCIFSILPGKRGLFSIVLLLTLLPSICLSIPTCSPSQDLVVSGTVGFFDLYSSHIFNFQGDASTIGWHLKILNPEGEKVYGYYPIMLLRVYERRQGQTEFHLVKSTPESCMEPSIYLDNPVDGAQYEVRIICDLGLEVEYRLYAMTYYCDPEPAVKKTPSWLSERIGFVQNAIFAPQSNERTYRKPTKAKQYVEELSNYFDNNKNPPGGTDCLDRAVYLFAAAQQAGCSSSVVIWGPKVEGKSGHANVLINGKLFDSTSDITDVSYFKNHYELVGVADTYEMIAFYLDPSVW